MRIEIKNKIEKELIKSTRNISKTLPLKKFSPLLLGAMKDFMLRPGKRIRPTLFVIGYLGFAKKVATNLYASAVSIELLHDFFLVHDDIIDKSDTRRGKPSMHILFRKHLSEHRNIKFNGQDLALIAGDIIYSIAIHTFLAINEKKERKEKALKKFIEAALHTGCGEFNELLLGMKDIGCITKNDILNIYDYKTASYTFVSPLSCGAILAGAHKNQIDKLSRSGIYLGRAFQIKDDILGMFVDEKKTGKSSLTDLKEAKKTILIWYAYHHTNQKNRRIINRILSKSNANKTDLTTIRNIMLESGALGYAEGEISQLIKRAQKLIATSGMRLQYKKLLERYISQLLS